tara:strand:+ start:3300 stop:7301 length:4002 start_codon:yes stop_codon:yes gene_type:complete
MLALSKYFKQDIIDTNQTLKPILIITEPSDESVLFTLTQDKDDILDSDGNRIRSISCISKISNVRISTDYDSKKLKINRLRCTLYNYYDVNTKLSEYINKNITNKNVYLFYKSPTTNVINLENELNDYDCALVYRGSISRINFNDTSLDLSIEDKTQIKIADKQVPYMSVDKLPLDIRSNVLQEYNEDGVVVPMTFGKVDKAPVLPYTDSNNDAVMNLLFDVQPTAGNYKTAKIPSLLDNTPTNDYYFYIKQRDDYIILDHKSYTINYQYQLMSRAKLYSVSSFSNNYLVPEIQGDNEFIDFELWDFKGFHQRQVDSVYASDGSILDVKNVEIDNITNSEFENTEVINNNNNKEKIWYRKGDDISSGNDNFDTGLKHYPANSDEGIGRWIVLKLDDGFSNQLLNISVGGEYIGNTFLCCDWQMYQSLNNSVPNNTGINQNEADRTGFFVAPIATGIWGNPDIFNLDKQSLLNALLLTTEEELQESQEEDFNNIQELQAPTGNTYQNAPFYLLKDEPRRSDSKYWGENGSSNIFSSVEDWKNINGLYYGDNGAFDRKLSNEANSHNLIAIFEYFPPSWRFNSLYDQGLKINNIGFLQSVFVEDIHKEKFYASIRGRKNHLYTEQLDPETYDVTAIPEFPLGFYTNGQDGTLPDFNLLLNNFYEIVSQTFNSSVEYYTTDEEIRNFIFSNGWQFNLSYFWNGYTNFDDSALWKSYNLFSEYIWKMYNLPLRLFYSWDALFDGNESWDFNDWGSFGDDTYNTTNRNFATLFNESWAKAFAKDIYEYLYQTNIEYEYNYEINYHWLSESVSQITVVNMTDKINNLRQYRWNSFDEINTFDDWVNNFYVYMDDLSQAIHQALIEDVASIHNSQYHIDRTLDNHDYPLPQVFYTWEGNMNEWADSNPYVLGLGNIEGSENSIIQLAIDLSSSVAETYEGDGVGIMTTDGIIRKPSDIVMNILTNEMEYAKYNDEGVIGNEILAPDYDQFDMDSIIESREAHNWNMGFSVDKKTDGKKLIEKILNESKSYPRFTSDGRFGLLTIKESYTYDDIDTTIKLNDIISYSFKQTKREDILTSVKMFYRYDYGQKKYYHYHEQKIEDLLDGYTGMEMYNLDPTDSHKDINLKYHSDRLTVEDFARYTLLNNCNPHNMVEMTLPLNYMNLSVGDKIHIPLINNEKIFNIDYSKVDFLNGQPIYPLWMIMETNVGTTSIKIKAYQLHYLGTDGNHQFEMPDTNYEVIGNTFEFSSYNYPNGDQIPNWNYNPNANVDNGYQIPYFDVTGDGFVNVNDIVAVVNHITGNTELDNRQKERLQYYSNGTLKTDNVVNVNDLVSLVNIITNE